MTAVFTTFFRTLLYNSLDRVAPLDPNTNLFNPAKSLHWVFFRSHAAFTDANDPRYTAIKTVSELSGLAGWSAPLTPNSGTHSVGTTTSGTSTFCIDNAKYPMGGGWVPATVTAAALILEGSYTAGSTVTDPIVFITDTPFTGGVVMRPGDTLWGRPIPALAGNRSLFSWPVWATGQTSTQPVEGSIAVVAGPPAFEAAYTHHAWLFPQRVNMIANPSFESLAGTNHWRSNGTIAQVLGTVPLPVAPGGNEQNTHYGRFTGTAPVVAESNLFPFAHRAAVNDQWTIQAMVRGTGRVRVGLIGWEPDFVAAGADWGDTESYSESWPLSPNSYTHVFALRRSFETTSGLVRFECSGGEMHLDNVLCEPDWLRDWRYFDGDTTFGARDDYSWYGGDNQKGQSYSCFYNHRRAVIGRLFAWDIEADDFTITDEEVEAQGFVYKWIPAGVRVAAHLDVLWEDDIQEAVPNNAGTPVTPYNNGTNGGVANPWTEVLGGSAGGRTTVGQANLSTAALPTGSYGPEQRITVSGTPTVPTCAFEVGVSVQFARAGRITKLRYYRMAGTATPAVLSVWANGTGTRLAGPINDSQGSGTNGYQTVTLPTPVPVAAGQTIVSSISGGPLWSAVTGTFTNTADCTGIDLARYNGTTGLYPGTGGAGSTVYVEPIFEPLL